LFVLWEGEEGDGGWEGEGGGHWVWVVVAWRRRSYRGVYSERTGQSDSIKENR